MKTQKIKKLQKECDDFNSKYPVGTQVFLKKDFVDDNASHRHSNRSKIFQQTIPVDLSDLKGQPANALMGNMHSTCKLKIIC